MLYSIINILTPDNLVYGVAIKSGCVCETNVVTDLTAEMIKVFIKISQHIGVALFSQELVATGSAQASNRDAAEQKFTSLHPEKLQEF